MTRGERIRELRQQAGLTHQELGLLLGVHHDTVSRWERGVRTPPPYLERTIEAIVKEKRR